MWLISNGEFLDAHKQQREQSKGLFNQQFNSKLFPEKKFFVPCYLSEVLREVLREVLEGGQKGCFGLESSSFRYFKGP